MLVHAGKYRTEDKLKIQTIQKLNTTQKKQTTQNTAKLNYPSLVASYDTQPGNEVGLFYKTNEATWGVIKYILLHRPRLKFLKAYTHLAKS